MRRESRSSVRGRESTNLGREDHLYAATSVMPSGDLQFIYINLHSLSHAA